MVERIRPGADRTEHVCPLLEPAVDSAVLAMASDAERGLERDESRRQSCTQRAVLGRLVARAAEHVRNQSLRPFRSQAGISFSKGPGIYKPDFQETLFLQVRAPPSPARIHHCFLVDSENDSGSFGLCLS